MLKTLNNIFYEHWMKSVFYFINNRCQFTIHFLKISIVVFYG